VNRTQGLVLGFFLVVAASLVVLLAAAPDVYDQALRLPSDWPRWTPIAFLVALCSFIGVLAIRGAVLHPPQQPAGRSRRGHGQP
jgi:hypothetical protein